jgi:hypothetical protein
MKIVREKVNEEFNINEKAEDILAKEISHLRYDVFPKMSDDELQYFMKKLADWTLNMLGEKPVFHGKDE